jgi:hypothetical protein
VQLKDLPEAELGSVVEGVERWFNPKYLALFAEQRPELTAGYHDWLADGISGCGPTPN